MRHSHLFSFSGMALHTCILTPKHKDTKAVLFFCHGFGDNISFLKRYNFFKYVNEGIAVVAIEYEGHGRSDGPLCLIPDFNQTVTDAVEFFQEVAEERFAGKKCFLMGEVSVWISFSSVVRGRCSPIFVSHVAWKLTVYSFFAITVHGRSNRIPRLQDEAVVVQWGCCLHRTNVQNLRFTQASTMDCRSFADCHWSDWQQRISWVSSCCSHEARLG